jgi:hypothetical protein
MFARLLLTFALVFSIQSASAEDRPEVGRYVKCFAGDTGVKVWMTRIGPESNREVIIQVVGVDHPWDKLITKHKAEINGGKERYKTTVDGSDWATFVVTETRGELYLPKADRPFKVTYDEGLSMQGRPQHFLTDYLKQEAEKAGEEKKQ